MKKGLVIGFALLLVAGLLVSGNTPVRAATPKVVKIAPARIESAPVARQKVEPVEPTTIEELPPQPAPVVEVVAPPPAYKMSGPFIGASAGIAKSSWAAGLGLGTTLFTIADTIDINPRVGAGYISVDNGKTKGWTVGADLVVEFRSFASPSFPLSLHVGAGVFYPFAMSDDVKGEIGYEAFGGVFYNLTTNIQLGAEVGYQKVNWKKADVAGSESGILGRLGIKWFF